MSGETGPNRPRPPISSTMFRFHTLRQTLPEPTVEPRRRELLAREQMAYRPARQSRNVARFPLSRPRPTPGPVFSGVTVFPQTPEYDDDRRNNLESFADPGKIDEIIQAKVPTTIELPPNSKLFQYTWVVGGIPRTLLVPMPMNATEEDVKAMLPQIDALDPSMFEHSRLREELPMLVYPDGTTPNIELIVPKQEPPES